MPKLDNLNQPLNLPQLEEQILSWWQETDAFKKSIQLRSSDKSFVFYDGPPFATGMPHYGHLLASTTKDVIPRYQTMKGFQVERVWGWDCHGLPIENMIEQQLGIEGGKKGIEKLGIDKFNQACRSEVLRLDKEWERIINRLGRWVDFENNYRTMDLTFMESVWWGFKQLHEKDLIYEGRRVILYCPRCSTPLSNFEIAMDNSYEEITEPSTTYKYPLKNQSATYLLAWSTTPWNKLATPALAVNPNLEYSQVKQSGKHYILATSRLKEMLIDEPYEIEKTFTGQELTQLEFEPHYDFYPDRADDERFGVIVADEFVTADEGTGIVTLAVYGEDDYRVMQREQIQLIEHVDETGHLKPEVTTFAGMDLNTANPMVDQDLASRNLIYHQTKISHSVATCYRCGTRLYHAPLPAWFVDVNSLKSELITQNEKINWIPSHLKHGRFKKGLETAPDWNISRSRYWGTPMPIWRGEKDGQVLTRIIGSLEELINWAVEPQKAQQLTDLHREFVDDLEVWVDDEKTVKGRRLSEVFDCWVESGSMPFAAIHYPFENKDKFEKNYPAQFVSEYIAQTRAWFYTMHVISVGIFGQPPFENVLTTGTILAEDGTKMSKSKQNFPDPEVLINKYGVDSLRLYLMSSTVMKGENLNFNENEVSDISRKVFGIWSNTLKFFQLFADKNVEVTKPPAQTPHIMDQWLLSKVASLITSTTKYLDDYDLIRASRQLMEFVDQLSTWYLRLSRNRLRQDDNQDASQAFGYALYTLAQLMAPFAPYFAELVHHQLIDENTSIHHTDWPQTPTNLIDQSLETEMELIQSLVNAARAKRAEAGINLRQPLASLKVSSSHSSPRAELLTTMAEELNVKAINWQPADTEMVELDLNLTPKLQAEGEARELMRTIAQLRRKAGLKFDQQAKLIAPTWPENWQTEIEERTNTKLIKGQALKLKS